MRHITVRAMLALSVALGLATAGCTQFPTEKQGVVDLRPQISFQLSSPELGTAEVLVDGLPMGQAGQYAAGVASLRVLPGMHELQVVANGRTLLIDRVYLGDGVNKTFLLK